MNEEKELLLNEIENTTERNVRKLSILASFHGAYLLFVHLVLAFLLLKNLPVSRIPERRQHEIAIIPELRHLGQVIKNEHVTNHKAYSNFSGPPNSENSAVWKHLLEPLYFNASESEIKATGASPSDSVRLKEGGYIASLGVYHELHCLNKLRYLLYTPDKATDNEWIEHLDHCIEVLRLTAMCYADLSVFTFSWPNRTEAPFLDAHSASSRQCVNWSELEEKIWPREVGLTPTLLRIVPEEQA